MDEFRDGSGSFEVLRPVPTGVWVTDRPIDSNEKAWGDTVLEIEVTESALYDSQVLAEGHCFREYRVPRGDPEPQYGPASG